MSVNLKCREIPLKEIVCSKYGQTKVESDLIVPDSKPDIGKILQVCGKSVITQKTAQQDKVYIQGVINLTVVYIPEGGGIKSILCDLDFSHIIDAKGSEPGHHIWTESEVEAIDYSIVNSRKISIKADLGIDIKICKGLSPNLPTGFNEDCGIQAKYKEMSINCSSLEEEQDFRIKEKLEIPSGKKDICEIIKSSAKAHSTDLRYSDGRINAAGDIALSILYSADDGSLCSLEEAVPFNETLEGMTLPDGDCEAAYNIKEMTLSIEEAPDGTRRFIDANILVCGIFKTTENIKASAIADAFGTQNPVKLSKTTYDIESIMDKSTVQIAHKESVSVPDYLPEVYKVYDLSGEARVTGISIEDGRINVEGEILSNIIYEAMGEGSDISGFCHISSFTQSLDLPTAKADSICEAKVDLDHSGFNISSDKELELRFIVNLTISLLKSETVEIIDSIEINENEEKQTLPPAIIYFPDEGETVWDIAKRYMATPEDIIKNNGLETEELHKGQKICIFR